MKTPPPLSALDAAIKVLQSAGSPLHYKEITRRILAAGLWQSSGKTPAATISAQLGTSVKKLGVASPFRRAGRGLFALNSVRTDPAPRSKDSVRSEEQSLYVCANCETDKYHAECNEIENPYIRVYINHLVKKYRAYNSNEFIIRISGLGRFIDREDVVLTSFIEQLSRNRIHLEFDCENDHVDQIDIGVVNASTNMSYDLRYTIQDLVSTASLSSQTDIPMLGIFLMRIIAHIILKSKTLYKAIVLDLDETVWPGTLSEIGADHIRENLISERGIPYIVFMRFCKILATELGIFIAICSRNSSDEINNMIDFHLTDDVFPLKNQIDCLIANSNKKSENIERIAKELSILPDSIVFVDDNEIVRDEVRSALPSVFVPEWSNHTELSTQLIVACLFERAELSLPSRNRRKQYRTLQIERNHNLLPELAIKVFDDCNHIESKRLYSKSNQFKISAIDDYDSAAISLYFKIYRGNGEDLGVCSAVTYRITNGIVTLINWTISCRYFEIGVEEFVLLHLSKIASEGKARICYQESEHNAKVKQLFKRYCVLCEKRGSEIDAIIEFTEVTLRNLRGNTNLRDANE